MWINPAEAAVGFPDGIAYDLLDSGVPVRIVESGLTTMWQNDVGFGGRVVPRHIEIHALGRTLLTADIAIAPRPAAEGASFDLPGEAAQPGQTLRPFDPRDVKVVHSIGIVPLSDSGNSGPPMPPGTGFQLRCVFDRKGVPHEIEVVHTIPPGRKGKGGLPDYLVDPAKRMVDHYRQQVRVWGTIDGNPCEWAGGAVVGS